MSDHFAASWLALREPVDHRSRNEALLEPLRHWANRLDVLRVLDLGAGTGSNLRYLAPRLPMAQRWRLLDHDAALLRHVRPPNDGVRCRTLAMDLRQVDAIPLESVDLVTASALLDLASEEWLHRLAERCVAHGAAALFALNYAGGIRWTDTDPEDAVVLAAFHAHHRGDKGFGPALGGDAGRAAADRFRRLGCSVHTGSSPWQLGPDDQALYHTLLDGWYEAASEQQPARADAFQAWAARRRAAPVAVTVEHLDVLALPAARS